MRLSEQTIAIVHVPNPMKRKTPVTAILLILISSFCNDSCFSQDKTDQDEWSPERSGIKIRAYPMASEYKLGDKILVNATVKNCTDKEISFFHNPKLKEILYFRDMFLAKADDNADVPPADILEKIRELDPFFQDCSVLSISFKSDDFKLPAYQQEDSIIDISKYFNVQEPGAYYFSLSRVFCTGTRKKPVTVCLKTSPAKIVITGAANIQKNVSPQTDWEKVKKEGKWSEEISGLKMCTYMPEPSFEMGGTNMKALLFVVLKNVSKDITSAIEYTGIERITNRVGEEWIFRDEDGNRIYQQPRSHSRSPCTHKEKILYWLEPICPSQEKRFIINLNEVLYIEPGKQQFTLSRWIHLDKSGRYNRDYKTEKALLSSQQIEINVLPNPRFTRIPCPKIRDDYDKILQERNEFLKSCLKPEYKIPDLDMEMIAIKPGEYRVEKIPPYVDSPEYTSRISNPFYISKYEIMQAQYERIAGENPSQNKGPKKPVEMISWYDALEFCRKLTARERAAKRIPDDMEYRLPLSSEWMHCYQAGTRDEYPVDYEKLEEYAWYWEESSQDIGLLKPNSWGLYDIMGNVWEWTFIDDVNIRVNAGDKKEINEFFPAIYGGSWDFDELFCSSWCGQYFKAPYEMFPDVGFRVVLGPIIDLNSFKTIFKTTESSLYCDAVGTFLFSQGKYKEALDMFERAIKLNENPMNSIYINYKAGKACLKLGYKGKALVYLKKAYPHIYRDEAFKKQVEEEIKLLGGDVEDL